jgi:predicted glycogen debranching enzyme
MTPFTVDTRGQLSPHDRQEWLLTNSTGAFADGTVVGMNTRRYHGLLVAATAPPVGRVVTVNRLGETLTLDGDPQPHELSINTFANGLLHPRGDQYLTRFTVGADARWGYVVGGARVDKHVQLCWGRQATAVRYTVYAGIGPDGLGKPFRLDVRPFLALRDFHALRHAGGSPFTVDTAGLRITVRDTHNRVTITADAGTYADGPDWWYGQVYPVETERGQDDAEDLFTPGTFTLAGRGRGTFTLWITTDPDAVVGDYDAELARRPAVPRPPRPTSQPVNRLARAAADFVVARRSPDGSPGTTVIAGYPWFSDWGRDTMIALPGLLLTTRRFAEAKQVLSVFAQYVDGGMIPNRFDDYTNVPEYNTVDASLWFVHAAFEYARLSGDDDALAEVLMPACRKIIDGYRDGTRYHIGMDPADGLIHQGDADTQLTWMDAKIGNVVFTPRQGKPVEIQALWHHALVLMREDELAARVADSIQQQFWLGDDAGLADVVHDGVADRSVRPNQIFAVSLPNSALTPEQQQAVVAVVHRELLTPVGLRTLAASDPRYVGRYTGDQFHRDGSYHNGTVWPWLLGPFLDAYLRVNEQSPAAASQARAWLKPLLSKLTDEGCIGQVAEIFDGDEPRRPVGCYAQAWSVAELLRVAVAVGP